MALKTENDFKNIVLAWMVRRSILLFQNSIDDLTGNISRIVLLDSVEGIEAKIQEATFKWSRRNKILLDFDSVKDLAQETVRMERL